MPVTLRWLLHSQTVNMRYMSACFTAQDIASLIADEARIIPLFFVFLVLFQLFFFLLLLVFLTNFCIRFRILILSSSTLVPCCHSLYPRTLLTSVVRAIFHFFIRLKVLLIALILNSPGDKAFMIMATLLTLVLCCSRLLHFLPLLLLV